MPKFRKKPVVIEARQVKNPLDSHVAALDTHDLAMWCGGSLTLDALGYCILINTLEGQMRADPGDWIIRGVMGEFYPCKDAIFAATYEEVTDGEG